MKHPPVTKYQVEVAVAVHSPVIAAHMNFEGMAVVHFLPDGKGGVFVRDETASAIGFPGGEDWPERRNKNGRPR